MRSASIEEPQRFAEAGDVEFHLRIAQASGNSVLASMLERIRVLVFAWIGHNIAASKTTSVAYDRTSADPGGNRASRCRRGSRGDGEAHARGDEAAIELPRRRHATRLTRRRTFLTARNFGKTSSGKERSRTRYSELVKQYESLDASPPCNRVWWTPARGSRRRWGRKPASETSPPAEVSASSLAIHAPTPSG